MVKTVLIKKQATTEIKTLSINKISDDDTELKQRARNII